MITIFTSLFKADNYIETFLNDIGKQTYIDKCELLLMNIKNSHNNNDYILKCINKQTYNIRVVDVYTDEGLYETWNIAIKLAKYNILTNWNIDDTRHPNHIQYCVSKLNDNISIVSTSIRLTSEVNKHFNDPYNYTTWFDTIQNKKNILEYIKPNKILNIDDFYRYDKNRYEGQNWAHCSPIWKKELHIKYGYFNEVDYGCYADFEFWLRCIKNEEKHYHLNKELTLYYENKESHNRINKSIVKYNKIMNMYFNEKTAIFTICTHDYIKNGISLANSIHKYHKNIHIFILIQDSNDIPCVNIPNLFYITLQELIQKIEIAKDIVDKYFFSSDQLRWSLKGSLLQYGLKMNYTKCVFFDNDIYVYKSLNYIFDKLDEKALILTPHNRIDKLWDRRTGSFNAGFIGINNNAIDILNKWSELCLDKCTKYYNEGYYDDQKYLDELVIEYFKDVYIINDVRYNVAEWSIDKLSDYNNIVFIHWTETIKKSLTYPLLISYLEVYNKSLILNKFDEYIKNAIIFNTCEDLTFDVDFYIKENTELEHEFNNNIYWKTNNINISAIKHYNKYGQYENRVIRYKNIDIMDKIQHTSRFDGNYYICNNLNTGIKLLKDYNTTLNKINSKKLDKITEQHYLIYGKLMNIIIK
jgi:hypothetical protein